MGRAVPMASAAALDRTGLGVVGRECQGEFYLLVLLGFFALQSFEMALGMRLRGVWVGCDPM